jgi:hypothetical protein
MNQKAKSLLETACSLQSPQQQRESAFLELMLLIENRYQINSNRGMQAGTDECITDTFQDEIVYRMGGLLKSEESNEILCSAVSVLGASRSPHALRLLVDLINTPEMRTRVPVLHAAVANIDSLSFFSREEPLQTAFKGLPVRETLNAVLPTGNDLLDDRVHRALANLGRES